MRYSICSFSFRKLLASGKQDIFQYIADCKELGCAALEPWSAHLAKIKQGDDVMYAGDNPGQADVSLDAEDDAFLDRVKAAADEAGLPFGCVATDGPVYIYEPQQWKREANRKLACRWIDAAGRLGAAQIRIDPGCWDETPADEVFDIIIAGYRDLVAYGSERGVEVLIENHWGCSNQPANLVRILEAVEGLGMLFDTNNWPKNKQAEGWRTCAKYARATHVKALYWADDGEELTQHIGHAIRLLRRAGYDGIWGIESMPLDEGVDEFDGVRRSIELIRKYTQE